MTTPTGEPAAGVVVSWWFPAVVLAVMLLILVPAAAWVGALVAARLDKER